ncbi:MAG: VOC family protein [Actinobacteria bacterium]|nr:VOC family protein [Actinomycetota bacterium]
MIGAIHHLDLVVTSLDRGLPFYQDLLGWTESGYNAVFFYDPDGLKLEIVHQPAGDASA